jgi:hypothetical protein
MRTAESVLKELNERLDLPARRKTALLRELRADFDDLVATLVAEGFSEEAARERALRMLAPTEDEFGTLAGLHQPVYVQLERELGPDRVRVLERVGIGAMASLAVLAPMLALTPSPQLPLLTLVVLACVAVPLVLNLSWQAFRIVVRGEADAASLARAGAIQAGLVSLILTVGGLLVLEQALRALSLWEAGLGMDVVTVASAVSGCAGIASITLGLTIFGVFGSLALLHWHISATGFERELAQLLEPAAHFQQE